MKYARLLASVLLIALTSCEEPESLEAIAGVEGMIQFLGEMPDSIKAVALVILEPEALNDQENIGKYLVNYSDPIVQSGQYFIQLKPGPYMGVLVGLLIDPGLFVVNIDSYLESSDIPLVQITQNPVGLFIQEGKTSIRDWEAPF